jgi:hypothetical protein
VPGRAGWSGKNTPSSPPAYTPAHPQRGGQHQSVVVVDVGGDKQVGLLAAGPDRRRWGRQGRR